MQLRVACGLALLAAGCSSGAPAPTPESLGALLFADPSLSEPPGQACADCHALDRAFTDPESDRATSAGAVAGRFGSRNSPTAMYASYVPPLALDADTQRWRGGLFWDGRADTLEEQAKKPLLNPLEMNNADAASVVAKVRSAPYAASFRALWGTAALDDPDAGFAHVVQAIAAYERSATFAPFSSKYDRQLAGAATLTDAEQRGLAIFSDPARGNCASCHPPPLFTNFAYVNLGVPKYANNPFYRLPPPLNPDGAAYVDHGLMATVGDPAEDGRFRVPTLRNVAVTGPYAHNGYFENLEYVIDFHNTRDVGSPDVGAWPAPEVAATVERGSVGDLGLSAADVLDLVAFLGTLTDDASSR